ncbi:MAG TPA: nitroreductase family protein [Chloroflexota bacterium]|nr:nitroreductase family protein [Chloroflexota bacterium]
MDAGECIRSLRAVRTFRPEPLSRDAILHILEAGRWSGCAKNVQLWQLSYPCTS